MTINLQYGSSFQIISLTELEQMYHTSQACEKWSQDITLARKQKDAQRMQRLLENKNDQRDTGSAKSKKLKCSKSTTTAAKSTKMLKGHGRFQKAKML